jgi:hypothetical protein
MEDWRQIGGRDVSLYGSYRRGKHFHVLHVERALERGSDGYVTQTPTAGQSRRVPGCD